MTPNATATKTKTDKNATASTTTENKPKRVKLTPEQRAEKDKAKMQERTKARMSAILKRSKIGENSDATERKFNPVWREVTQARKAIENACAVLRAVDGVNNARQGATREDLITQLGVIVTGLDSTARGIRLA